MTLYKCGITLLTLGPGRTPVIALFLRDGVFWFLALVRKLSIPQLSARPNNVRKVVSIVEIVLWDKARPTLAQIPVVYVVRCFAEHVLTLTDM